MGVNIIATKALLAVLIVRFAAGFVDQIPDINNELEFAEALEEAGNKLVVIQYWSPWCGPCRMMSMVIQDTISDYPDVLFYKVNTDEVSDVARLQGITSLPQMIMYKNFHKVKQVQTMPKSLLKEIIDKNM